MPRPPILVGGGGGVIGLLQIGPDFGEGAGNDGVTHRIGVHASMDEVEFTHDKTVGVHASMDLVEITYNQLNNVGVQLTMPEVEFIYNALHNIGVQMTMPEVEFIHDKTVGVHASFDLLEIIYNALHNIGVQMTMPEVEFIHDKTVGVHASFDLMEITYNPLHNIGVQMTMPEVAFEHTKIVGVQCQMDLVEITYNAINNVGVRMTMPEVEFEHTKTVGVQMTMPEVAFEHTKTVGVHLSGEVLGAPFYIAEVHTTVGASATTITVNVPAGTQSGDLLLAFITSQYATNTMSPDQTGWTADLDDDNNLMANFRMRLFWRIAGASEPGSYSWTVNTTLITGTGSGEIHTIRGANTTTPINVTAKGTDAGQTVNVIAVTTTVINCLVFYFLYHTHTASQTHTPPSTPLHIERNDYEVGSVASANLRGLSAGTRVFAATGATGTADVVCNQIVATNGIFFRVAIAPGTVIMAA